MRAISASLAWANGVATSIGGQSTRGALGGADAAGRIPPGGMMPAMGDHDPARRRRRAARPPDPSHFRHSYSKDTAQLMRRLSRMEGQVRGIARMIEREEYCVDILQQTAALRAAVDALSILILEDHVQGCVRTAAEQGEADSTSTRSSTSSGGRSGRPVRGPARPADLSDRRLSTNCRPAVRG